MIPTFARPLIPFIKVLRVLKVPRGHFKTAERYPVIWEHKRCWYRFFIEKDFVYDRASIPRIFWPIVSPDELGFLAPAAHDFIIVQEGKVEVELWYGARWIRKGTVVFTREEADKLFCYLMRREEIARWKRRSAYKVVWLYGQTKKQVTGKEW